MSLNGIIGRMELNSSLRGILGLGGSVLSSSGGYLYGHSVYGSILQPDREKGIDLYMAGFEMDLKWFRDFIHEVT